MQSMSSKVKSSAATACKDLNLSMDSFDCKDFMDLAFLRGILREDVANSANALLNLIAKLFLKGPYFAMMLM